MDPLPAYRFDIVLRDVADSQRDGKAGKQIVAGFSSCDGLQINTEIYEYKEGGLNTYVHKFVTRTSHSNIVLKRGITFSDDLWKWYQDVVSGKIVRKSGEIIVMNDMDEPTAIWSFRNALPLRISGSDLNAMQNQVAIETLELSHEGLERLSIQ